MLDLRHFIRVYDQTLDATTCRRLIDGFEACAQLHRPIDRRFDTGSAELTGHWVELKISASPIFDEFVPLLVDRTREYARRYANDTDHTLLPFEFETFKIKRYEPEVSGMFPPHVDVASTVSMHRMLAVLWYLNDVDRGGETWFGKLDVKVEPRCGRLLMFPPIFMYPHAGMPPRAGRKYIIGTYLSYLNEEP